MEFVSRLFGRPSRQRDEREPSRLQAASREQSRRELIATALCDTLRKHRLPQGCITAEASRGSAVGAQGGVHLQLVFQDWQPRLLAYVVALETAVTARLACLDPLSSSWITGVSWRFEPKDRTLWPQFPAARRLGIGPLRAGAAGRRNTMTAFDRLEQSREEELRGRAAANSDFPPTLPMDGK